MEEWPPEEFDYERELRSKGYRCVENGNWLREEEKD
jgi:hypothetical protein